MICFIPAAGFGKRMGTLTLDTPKPLLKIGNETFLDKTIKMAKNWGINKFIINTHYQAEKIHREILKYGDIEIVISHEKDKILGTAGGMRTGLAKILKENDYFLTINPDIIYKTNINILSLIDNYKGNCLLFLIKTSSTKYTRLNMINNKIYFESGDYIYTGISYINYSILKKIPTDEYYDLATIFKDLALKNELDGIEFPGEYIDLGDEESYYKYISLNHDVPK